MLTPNTTQTPNNLFDQEMKKMSESELKIVLTIIRATLGWIQDSKTGMRKQEDWITISQLIDKTGLSNTSISEAINSCVKNNWIEVRDKNGNILDTPQKRTGQRIFYRVGNIFLRNQTYEKSSEVESEPMKKVNIKKVHITKETIYTKELRIAKAILQNPEFSFTEYLNQLLKDKRKDLRIVASYWKEKGFKFDTKRAISEAIGRDLKASKKLEGYTEEKIISVFQWLTKNVDFKWTLETVHKYIDEDLKKFSNQNQVITLKELRSY